RENGSILYSSIRCAAARRRSGSRKETSTSRTSSHQLGSGLPGALPDRDPDDEREHSQRRGKGSGKQPQRAMKNRLAIELDPDIERRAVKTIRQVLFPGENVPALRFAC